MIFSSLFYSLYHNNLYLFLLFHTLLVLIYLYCNINSLIYLSPLLQFQLYGHSALIISFSFVHFFSWIVSSNIITPSSSSISLTTPFTSFHNFFESNSPFDRNLVLGLNLPLLLTFQLNLLLLLLSVCLFK